MLERLPERMRTPAAARAITAPSAILLAGVGASAAILGGAPLAAAAAIGAVCWAGRVALGLPRKPREERIDPTMLRDPWRSLVTRAVRARNRFAQTVEGTDPGPLRDRLAEVSARVAVGVKECWRVARRGDALGRAVNALGISGIARQLAEVEEELRYAPRPDLEATAEAVRAQLESARRLQDVAEDTQDRLRRLAAQLDEAVARAVELSLSASDVGALQPLGSDVEGLVTELESLRLALEETAQG